ncbi:hypothetical protein BDV33DRAFT_138667 [Aspergillus novoparasiticus]|uniref:Uncharacterized protein n=1 Tax=Aspergillus novoparasiticus TaxID=986946 RepID=A0A5N6EIL5_9EURO|nr:hypothetical protein BDV33DRAFT_138667 [Aspergillus novoparasiticus]
MSVPAVPASPLQVSTHLILPVGGIALIHGHPLPFPPKININRKKQFWTRFLIKGWPIFPSLPITNPFENHVRVRILGRPSWIIFWTSGQESMYIMRNGVNSITPN